MDYNKNEEIWKDVEGYEEFYQISSLGRVKSKDRLISSRGGKFVKPGRVMKLHVNRTGYYYVLLTDGNKKAKNIKVHRLVAMNFIDNPLSKPFVNHIDGDKLNNTITNLEWVTPKENIEHAIEIGLFKPKEMCRHKKDARKIGMFSKDGELIKTFDFSKDAAEYVGTDSKTIIKVCNKYKSYKTAKGYKWEYI